MSSRLSHDTSHSNKEPTHTISTITIQTTPSRVDILNPKSKQSLSFKIHENGEDLDSAQRMRKENFQKITHS